MCGDQHPRLCEHASVYYAHSSWHRGLRLQDSVHGPQHEIPKVLGVLACTPLSSVPSSCELRIKILTHVQCPCVTTPLVSHWGQIVSFTFLRGTIIGGCRAARRNAEEGVGRGSQPAHRGDKPECTRDDFWKYWAVIFRAVYRLRIPPVTGST